MGKLLRFRFLPGDRVRAMVPFGDPEDEDFVPIGGCGTVVQPPHGPDRLWPVYVDFDHDPTPEPWSCVRGEIEWSGEPLVEA